MLSKKQNERLSRVGPGTPGGALLRHYWLPACPSGELTARRPKKRVRLLGEDLLVYRTESGGYACIEERCAHRGTSLFYGFVEGDEIRCCYHGWKYNPQGRCVEQPFEKRQSKKIKLNAYPAQEQGGLVFIYMGPHPEQPPVLPPWDVIARTDRPRKIRMLPVHHCNWLQIQENTVDMTHLYYLHGHMAMVNDLPHKQEARRFCRPITDYAWSPCQWGITKSMTYGGEKEQTVRWPPFIFPNALRTPEGIYGALPDGMLIGHIEAMHFRVPIDDDHTTVIWVGLMPLSAGRPGETVYEYVPETKTADGEHDLSDFYGQDRAVWETQGVLSDRTREHLGSTDGGIAIFRRMLAEQIDRVERGEEPTVGVVADRARNAIIDLSGRPAETVPAE